MIAGQTDYADTVMQRMYHGVFYITSGICYSERNLFIVCVGFQCYNKFRGESLR